LLRDFSNREESGGREFLYLRTPAVSSSELDNIGVCDILLVVRTDL
jgi:hypothetical protein